MTDYKWGSGSVLANVVRLSQCGQFFPESNWHLGSFQDFLSRNSQLS
jgi:hypothetical protein